MYLLKEGTEYFWDLESKSEAEAEEAAIMWNAVVIRPATAQETKKLKENSRWRRRVWV
jgi:hypothetical protein